MTNAISVLGIKFLVLTERAEFVKCYISNELSILSSIFTVVSGAYKNENWQVFLHNADYIFFYSSWPNFHQNIQALI